MKELADFGFGRFVKGANGKGSRIEWLVPPRTIYGAVKGQPEELELAMSELLAQGHDATVWEIEEKAVWSLHELLELLVRLSGLPIHDLRIVLMLPESRRLLARSQGIEESDVLIHFSV